MLLSKSVIENTNDFYGLWKGYTDNMFTHIEKTLPQYHQSITNLLQESMEIWRNFACSSIDLQREFAVKTGSKVRMPESTIKIVHDITQESKTAIDVQNKIAIASIDATKQSLNTLNSNSAEFAAINKNLVELLPAMTLARS